MISDLVPHLLGLPHNLPHKRISVDYEEKAGVLYVSFKRSSHADNAQDDSIIRFETGEVIGDDIPQRLKVD